jgi:membrane-bound metal-dependent hydrolase YbcI (DUF457 family)
MPSPIGHALAGIAVGCLVGGRVSGEAPRRPLWRRGLFQRRERITPRSVILFGILGILPDIDFLFGQHSRYTHSIGAAVLIGVVVLACVGWSHLNTAFVASAAYSSHVLLDWLGTDTTIPYGVMAFWPLTDAHFLSGQGWFPMVCREYWLGNCWLHNIAGAMWELVLLVPLTGVALYIRSAD